MLCALCGKLRDLCVNDSSYAENVENYVESAERFYTKEIST